MNLKTLLILVSTAIFTVSCGGDAAKTTENKTAATQAKADIKYKNTVALESIPTETMQDLFENCTLIDYIFHDMPFSMSQDEKPSIQANLGYVATAPVAFIPANLKPIARMFYQKAGDIVLEADLYFSDESHFFVFVEDNKPKYANKMTQQGVDFLQKMFDQAKGAKKQAGGE